MYRYIYTRVRVYSKDFFSFFDNKNSSSRSSKNNNNNNKKNYEKEYEQQLKKKIRTITTGKIQYRSVP
jgi:hypothetical protein